MIVCHSQKYLVLIIFVEWFKFQKYKRYKYIYNIDNRSVLDSLESLSAS